MPQHLRKYKAVILLGGPATGTRFRPLSMDSPKPLFPVGGVPLIQHHIEACCKLEGMQEILLIGFYDKHHFMQFIQEFQPSCLLRLRYLQEFTPLGTAGGLFHFRDQILLGNPDAIIVMNSDVCSDFPLDSMQRQHIDGSITIMTTEAIRSQSMQYGCVVVDKTNNKIKHYVEKPSTFVSSDINCGVYIMSANIFSHIEKAVKAHQQHQLSHSSCFTQHHWDSSLEVNECVHLEKEVFVPLAANGECELYSFPTTRFWSQVKTASAAIYANRHILELYRHSHPERLVAGSPQITGDVYIHKNAIIHPSAVIGPNVSIGRFANIGAGVRIRDSIILRGATIRDHACVLHSIIGCDAVLGEWSRVEGTPNDPNPNKAFAKIETKDLFNDKGQLNPTVCIIGTEVQVAAEVIVRNSVVLPHMSLASSYLNQIIL